MRVRERERERQYASGRKRLTCVGDRERERVYE